MSNANLLASCDSRETALRQALPRDPSTMTAAEVAAEMRRQFQLKGVFPTPKQLANPRLATAFKNYLSTVFGLDTNTFGENLYVLGVQRAALTANPDIDTMQELVDATNADPLAREIAGNGNRTRDILNAKTSAWNTLRGVLATLPR